MVFKERLGNDHALTRLSRASLEATVARQYEEASEALNEVGWGMRFTRHDHDWRHGRELGSYGDMSVLLTKQR